MSYEPFKCPDCKVWWRGETHKCDSVTHVSKHSNKYPSDWIQCDKCGKNVVKKSWHTCIPLEQYKQQKKRDSDNDKKNNPPSRDA
jgi:hypothetical protein